MLTGIKCHKLWKETNKRELFCTLKSATWTWYLKRLDQVTAFSRCSFVFAWMYSSKGSFTPDATHRDATQRNATPRNAFNVNDLIQTVRLLRCRARQQSNTLNKLREFALNAVRCVASRRGAVRHPRWTKLLSIVTTLPRRLFYKANETTTKADSDNDDI